MVVNIIVRMEFEQTHTCDRQIVLCSKLSFRRVPRKRDRSANESEARNDVMDGLKYGIPKRVRI